MERKLCGYEKFDKPFCSLEARLHLRKNEMTKESTRLLKIIYSYNYENSLVDMGEISRQLESRSIYCRIAW